MIPVENIYYMLSYAFKILKQEQYKSVQAEEYKNAEELYAAILERGIAAQIKRGMQRGYVARTESLTIPRGKIEVSQSIRDMSHIKKQLVCTYDEYMTDTYMNRVIKSTVHLLLRSDITPERKKKFRKQMRYFCEVELLDVRRINWHMNFDRNNQTYRMLIGICYLIVHGLLQTETEGTHYLMGFSEPYFPWLYENFVYEYYQQEFPILNVSAPTIRWQLDNDFDELLPKMKTDITLSYNDKILIIDTKAYERIIQTHYDRRTIRSAHLYQIFAYVKNKETELSSTSHTVSGMLLYAHTDTDEPLNYTYLMSGNQISVVSLDLNCHHTEIAVQLNKIAWNYFGVEPRARR